MLFNSVMGREVVVKLIGAVGVMFIVAMVAGQFLGQPILFGYVTTGSMESTLDPGDGFIAIPAAVSGPIGEGDVVVFQAEELHGGGLTTHRVVGETDQGYVTRGDANPFTDQDNEEPPVKDAQIVATVWQPGGSVLVIPELGTVVMGLQDALNTVQGRLAASFGTRSLLGTQGLAYLMLGVSVVAYILDSLLGGPEQHRTNRQSSRETGTSTRLLVAAFAGLIVAAATASMVVPAGQEKFGVVSAESNSPGPRVIEQGTNETVAYPVSNGGLIPVQVFIEPETKRVNVEPAELKVSSRASVNASLTLSAPPETGYHREYVVQHRYLAILPAPTIRSLYDVHPWLPLIVIDGLIGGSFYLTGIAILGTGRFRSRSRTGSTASDSLNHPYSVKS